MIGDDIAAISTAPGEGGIAIVRLSGNSVIEKVEQIFQPYRAGIKLSDKEGYSLSLGWLCDEKMEIIDEVLLGLMRAPRSYTGEDVVEINCHGGTLPARRCLEAVMRQGIRLAQPGEFTRRAFLNGRLDVSQAEAVIEVIRAKTERGMNLALKQLAGRNSREISLLEDQLIEVNAMLEASLDFPDEVGDLDYSVAQGKLREVKNRIDKLLLAGERAEIYREGINVAICGKPNVGKSSLLNALLRKEKAIVTSVPGTTRDIIEDYINIRGIPVKLRDTAGIRFTEDLVERIGIERSQEVISEADLVLFILDVGTGIDQEDREIYEKIEKKNKIVLVNKEDLEEKNISETELEQLFPGVKIVRGSIIEETGLEELEESMEKAVLSGQLQSDDMEVMINLRQKNALLTAKRHIEDSLAVMGKVSLDCLGVDIWGALEALGEINGKNLKEEVIERIFHDFCIGK
ncbi:tRNA uridine-5-carboxymethylaminomethyl(34) synthesis GTPase MnmE [Syntrophomonas wolfei]|jgi:tRNA modification GTPase|uniref:tRNA uridine-5-carboxymethylaminomethyl(34) synthesis GTPase MnmE n=1 Tax=Syntrophomonas wolfei TaxID=863 RepID=UPI0023F307A8|nr:tRNA uridine-5-carboxymethylaminomethyl(34) synthesis GTPase MnmE [Syntrophomonas wolfei]